MSDKFAAGPWSLREWQATDTDCAIDICGFEVIDAQGCSVIANFIEGGTDAERANAQLIAAAPDLLNALRRLLDDSDDHLTMQGRRNLAHAAITKATGEAK